MHYEAVVNAVKSGNIAESTINKACKRIIAWKLKYLLNHAPEPEKKEEEEEEDYTVLIILSILLGILLVGSLIFFFIMWLKNRSKDEKVINEEISPETGLM